MLRNGPWPTFAGHLSCPGMLDTPTPLQYWYIVHRMFNAVLSQLLYFRRVPDVLQRNTRYYSSLETSLYWESVGRTAHYPNGHGLVHFLDYIWSSPNKDLTGLRPQMGLRSTTNFSACWLHLLLLNMFGMPSLCIPLSRTLSLKACSSLSQTGVSRNIGLIRQCPNEVNILLPLARILSTITATDV